jgi:hypothetical protein
MSPSIVDGTGSFVTLFFILARKEKAWQGSHAMSGTDRIAAARRCCMRPWHPDREKTFRQNGLHGGISH